MKNLHIHVSTPGDHYSFTTGSALMTLVYEFTRKHAAAGGRSQIIVGHGTRHDYPVGECIEVDFSSLPSSWQRAVDAALGRVGLPRHFANAVYAPACRAVPPDHDGPVFLQNAPGPVRLFKKQRPNAQVCLHVHNALFNTYSDREVRETVAAADRVICNCEFLAAGIRQRLGRVDDKIRVVHNGVDTERFRPNPELAQQQDEVSILFVARMVPEKGADLLIKAAQKIYGGTRKFKLRIVGNRGFSAADPLSPYEIELRRLAEPIQDAVEFLPFIDRHGILPIYQAASIFCAPSNWDEPCTLTVPESMACGVPAVVSRRGGIPEVAGDAALYFDTPNTDELAERLAYLVDDEKARAEWGAKARARAEEFDWACLYPRLLAAVNQ